MDTRTTSQDSEKRAASVAAPQPRRPFAMALSAASGALVAMAAAVAALVVISTRPETAIAPPAPVAPAVESDGLGLSAHTPRPVPRLTFVDGKNRPMTLADFHGPVLLNIWATWCVPCRKEMPSLDRLQAKIGGRDFQVVPLSIDREGVGAVELFYRQLGIKSLGIYVDQSFQALSGIDTPGLPTTLLIDAHGQEVARKVGPAEWDEPAMIARIRQLLHRSGDAAGATQ